MLWVWLEMRWLPSSVAEEFEIAGGCLLCQQVYPATDNLHDEIGVLGVEYHRRASAPPNCLNSAAFPSTAVANFMK